MNSKACRFLVHKFGNPEIHVSTIIESDNTDLFENIYLYKTKCDSTCERPKRPREESMENTLTIEDPTHSTRQNKLASFGLYFCGNIA